MTEDIIEIDEDGVPHALGPQAERDLSALRKTATRPRDYEVADILVEVLDIRDSSRALHSYEEYRTRQREAAAKFVAAIRQALFADQPFTQDEEADQ